MKKTKHRTTVRENVTSWHILGVETTKTSAFSAQAPQEKSLTQKREVY